MLEKEFRDIFRSIRSRIAIACVFLIPLLDLGLNVWENFGDFWMHREAYGGHFAIERVDHPCYASFLSGTTRGHMPQMLLLWLLPLFLLLICGDAYVREHKQGYHYLTETRTKKQDIFRSKIIAAFVTGFAVMLGSLLLNHLLAQLIFRNGISFHGAELYLEETAGLLGWSIQNPVLAYLIYIIVVSLLSGCCAAACVSLSFCLKSYKTLYSVCMIFWLLQILSPYSLTYVMQPFIEYGLEWIIPAVGIFAVLVGVSLVVGYWSKVRHETW